MGGKNTTCFTDESGDSAGRHSSNFCKHTITSGKWVAPKMVFLTNKWFIMAQSISWVTLEGHHGANGQVMA